MELNLQADLNLQVDAGDLDSIRLSPADPKVLLTDTDRRPYAARLALVLAQAGCTVSAMYSLHGHPLQKTRVVQRAFAYSALRPLDSLAHAITQTNPDLIIPCDDRGVQHLHELYAQTQHIGSAGTRLANLIERSLGAPEGYPLVSCRYDLLRVAHEEGLPVPHTRRIEAPEDLAAWHAEHPFPWVLKADGTWGGRGVRIANSPLEAGKFLREVSRPFRFHRAIKRMFVNRDLFWLRPWWERRKPAVIVQAHVQGRPANCAVVCWKGKVLAGIAVEVVSADGPTGPASVVRVVDNPKMMLGAERLASRLNLSGFFGLDFIIEDESHKVYLIEMNPRCTPLCHVRLGTGRDMIGALWAQLSGKPLPETEPVTENDLIAYFPQAWNSKSEFLVSSFHDVPQCEPDLVQELLTPWPERSFLFRMAAYLDQLKLFAVSDLKRKFTDYSGLRT